MSLRKIIRHFINPPSKPTSIIKTKRHVQGQRDEMLEKKAWELLQTHAPALAERVGVRWNPRLRTTAGLAFYHIWEILLNPALKTISEVEIEKTLKHELAHLLARDRSGTKRIAPHGKEWHQACIDLGIPGEKTTHQLPFVRSKQKRKFFYRCPTCNEVLSRVRRPCRDIACLSCCRKHAGGKYDKRFRYQLIK
jgi:predicted SprT family Zn-dependent metalloprotease